MQKKSNNIHLIAMSDNIMSSLAIALKKQGFNITGAYQYDTSTSLLKKKTLEWNISNISPNLMCVVLGMYVQEDNPELLRAKAMGLSIYSFPEFIYQQSKNKQRIVVGGSGRKSIITLIILHVLKFHKKKFDYVMNSNAYELEDTIKLSDAPSIIIDGSEYGSSCLNKTPQFLCYQHHIGIISEISHKKANVFIEKDQYTKDYEKFICLTPKAGSIIYNDSISLVKKLIDKEQLDIKELPFKPLPHSIKNDTIYLKSNDDEIELKVNTKHILLYLAAAKVVLTRLSIDEIEFLEAIQSFKLPSFPFNVLMKKESLTVLHENIENPSTVNITVETLKKHNPSQNLISIFDFYNLNNTTEDFLVNYAPALEICDSILIFIKPNVSLNYLHSQKVKSNKVIIVNSTTKLKNEIQKINQKNTTVLSISSSYFTELNFYSIFS